MAEYTVSNFPKLFVEEWDKLSTEEQQLKINLVEVSSRKLTYKEKDKWVKLNYKKEREDIVSIQKRKNIETYNKNRVFHDEFVRIGYKTYVDLSIEDWDRLTTEEKDVKLSPIIQPEFDEKIYNAYRFDVYKLKEFVIQKYDTLRREEVIRLDKEKRRLDREKKIYS